MAATLEVLKLFLVGALLCLTGCKQQSRTVRLVLQPTSTNNYPSYFASWLGFYKDEGVEVSISQIAGASKILEAVVGGSADVGGGVYEQTLQMAVEGKSIVCFVSLLKSPNFAIVAAPGVRTFADLKGKTVGVSAVGSPSQTYLNYALTLAGVKSSDVTTISIGLNASAIAALEHGKVDAAVLFGSTIPLYLARKPDAVMLADTRTPEGLRAVFHVDEYPASCLLAQRAWLDQNPEAAKKMSRAVVRALVWLRGHSPEEILAKIPAENRMSDPAAELAAIRLALPLYSEDGRINKESAEAVRTIMGLKVDVSSTFLNLN
jgi:NitT/TauT family transport system substrate-binding protein